MSSFSIFLIISFIGIFFFLKWAYKYNNPYKLYFVIGKKGSGKTSYLCKLALEYTRRGWAVYTNVLDIKVPGIRIIHDISDLGAFVPDANSVLLLDEVSLIWDNRHFKNFKDCTKEFFRLQRHYRCICYLFSQTFDVDKKVRDLSDRMYLCQQFLGRWSWLREIEKRITITESSPDSESRVTENLSFRGIFHWRFIYIPKYQPYFDSFVLPDREPFPYSQIPADVHLEVPPDGTIARIKGCAQRFSRWFIRLYVREKISSPEIVDSDFGGSLVLDDDADIEQNIAKTVIAVQQEQASKQQEGSLQKYNSFNDFWLKQS